MSPNPYIIGAPLRNALDFFGRQEILTWAVRQLHHPTTNALVLFGQRRIGKTSFLWKLQQSLPVDAFLPIYFNLQDQARSSLGQVLAKLAQKISKVASLSPPPSSAFDDQGHFFHHTFLPQLEEKLGTERRVVFLLDEFDMLEQVVAIYPPTIAAKALLPFLREVMSENLWPAFVFIMGKGEQELLPDFTATFKGALVSELWVLDQTSAEQLIHQATTNGTLQFTEEAVARILSLTNCHPYLTQLLCMQIWDRAYSAKPTTPPLITIYEVEASITTALKSGKQALIWWFHGLSPAEKIYAAALAKIASEKVPVPEEHVVQVLAHHAVRLSARSIKSASSALVTRRVLEVTKEGEYHFCIELFRRWVHQNQPLQAVKDEIPESDPLGKQAFSIGQDYFEHRQWENANLYFQHTLKANPRHDRARLHLGEAQLELGLTSEAVASLSRAYELNPTEAKSAYVRGLKSFAEANEKDGNDSGVLSACERILSISPDDPWALARRSAIWNRRGDVALAKDDRINALRAYQEAGNEAKMAEVEALQRRQALMVLEKKAQSHAGAERWAEAHAIYEQLIKQALDSESRALWQAAQAHCTDELELASLWQEGVRAMQQDSFPQAVDAFLQVVNRRHRYQKNGRRATQLLHEVVSKTAPISFPAPFFEATDSSAIRSQRKIRTYRNFDLRLAFDSPNRLLVEVLNAPAGEAMGRALINQSIDWELISDELPTLSQELGSLLMPGEVRERFFASLAMVSPQSGLRIRLRMNDQALSMLPWEATRIGEEYLNLQPHTPLVRYVRASEPPSPLMVDGPLQVLGIYRNPKDLPQLNVSLEQSRLFDALQPLIKTGRLNLTWLPRADTQLLQEALRQNPHVIHFIGHGEYDDDSQKGRVWFTDADGHAEALSADWLATLLRGSSVRFVFLNACESGRAAGGLAEVLVRRGIPAVLGMQTAVLDEVAIALAAGFYSALRDGYAVDAALVEGRKAIVNALGNSPDKADWTYPVLYMRAPDGRLFESDVL